MPWFELGIIFFTCVLLLDFGISGLDEVILHIVEFLIESLILLIFYELLFPWESFLPQVVSI